MDRIDRRLKQSPGYRIAQVAVLQAVKVIPVSILALDAGGDIRPIEPSAKLIHLGGTERAQVSQLHILIEAGGIGLPTLPEAIDVRFAIENGIQHRITVEQFVLVGMVVIQTTIRLV